MSVITVNSITSPGIDYTVDLEGLTCSCEHFLNRTYRYNREDPRRLCKHLVKVIIQYGIPDPLKSYENDIVFFAARGMAFSNREKLRKAGKLPVEPGTITTVMADKKVKYLYLAGKVNDTTIRATVDLKSGTTNFQINNYWGSYNPASKEIVTIKTHQYLADAVLFWLDEEYNKIII